MKPTPLLLTTALLAAASPARGQDTTSTRTLASHLPFTGIHLDWGGGVVPYLDRTTGDSGGIAFAVALMLPLRRFPEWSIGFSATGVAGDTTGYIAPGSTADYPGGYHPHLVSTSAALEIQRRWNERKIVHWLAGGSVGAIVNSYNYYHTVNGVTTYHQDEKRQVAFAQLSGGGELNIARWLRLDALLGYRTGGRMTIPQATGSNEGLTCLMMLAMGKFR